MGSGECALVTISSYQLKEAQRPLLGIVRTTSKTMCLGIFFSNRSLAIVSKDDVALGPSAHRHLAQYMLQVRLKVGDFARPCVMERVLMLSLSRSHTILPFSL